MLSYSHYSLYLSLLRFEYMTFPTGDLGVEVTELSTNKQHHLSM
jgi:hypothetical protein